MKLTKSQLKQIIKEELENVIEARKPPSHRVRAGRALKQKVIELDDWYTEVFTREYKHLARELDTDVLEAITKLHNIADTAAEGRRRYYTEEVELEEEKEEFLQDIKSTGEWTDYTIGELEKKKATLMKKKKRTADEVKTVRQLNFAINAKQGDYEKK